MPEPSPATVRVRFFAAARQAVGAAEEEMDARVGLKGILAELAARTEQIEAVLARCSFLVDGLSAQPTSQPLPNGATVDILPPFAGG